MAEAVELKREAEQRRGLELHARVLAAAGAPHQASAAYHFTEYYLPRLIWALERDFPGLRGDAELTDCALNALTVYLLKPEVYRPERGRLFPYLYRIAWADAANLLRSRKPRREEVPLEEDWVAVAPDDGKGWSDAVLGVVAGLPDTVDLADLRARVERSLRPEDRPVFDLLMEGDALLEEYAARLGLENRPRAEWARAVKQAKDRVWAALRRVRESYRDG